MHLVGARREYNHMQSIASGCSRVRRSVAPVGPFDKAEIREVAEYKIRKIRKKKRCRVRSKEVLTCLKWLGVYAHRQYCPLGAQLMGLTHLAIAVGSERMVDELTQRIKDDGYQVLDGPRRTGDGYYESVVVDPDGNRIEITA
jgi:hypothetical protein